MLVTVKVYSDEDMQKVIMSIRMSEKDAPGMVAFLARTFGYAHFSVV